MIQNFSQLSAKYFASSYCDVAEKAGNSHGTSIAYFNSRRSAAIRRMVRL